MNKYILLATLIVTMLAFSACTTENPYGSLPETPAEPGDSNGNLAGHASEGVSLYDYGAVPFADWLFVPVDLVFNSTDDSQQTILTVYNDTIFYDTGYVSLNDGNWATLKFKSSNDYGSWLGKNAITGFTFNANDFDFDEDDFANKNYVLFYSCTFIETNGTWDCHDDKWQAVKFNAQLIIQPVCTNEFECEFKQVCFEPGYYLDSINSICSAGDWIPLPKKPSAISSEESNVSGLAKISLQFPETSETISLAANLGNNYFGNMDDSDPNDLQINDHFFGDYDGDLVTNYGVKIDNPQDQFGSGNSVRLTIPSQQQFASLSMGTDKEETGEVSPIGEYTNGAIHFVLNSDTTDFMDDDFDYTVTLSMDKNAMGFFGMKNNLPYNEDFGSTIYGVVEDPSLIQVNAEFENSFPWSEIGISNPLEINFLGKNLLIQDASRNDELRLRTGNEFYLKEGDSAKVDGHVVTLERVGLSSILFKVDGQTLPVALDSAETFDQANDFQVFVESIFYIDGAEDNAATVFIGEHLTKTVKDGDSAELFGEPSDNDEADWLWNIDLTNNIIGLRLNIDRTNVDANEDDERNALGSGEEIVLPNDAGSINYELFETNSYDLTVEAVEDGFKLSLSGFLGTDAWFIYGNGKYDASGTIYIDYNENGEPLVHAASTIAVQTNELTIESKVGGEVIVDIPNIYLNNSIANGIMTDDMTLKKQLLQN